MRNLESSPYLDNPSLVEIKATAQGASRINAFTLQISITRSQEPDNKKPAGRAASGSPPRG
jgi:type IV pilus assembly protein PilN